MEWNRGDIDFCICSTPWIGRTTTGGTTRLGQKTQGRDEALLLLQILFITVPGVLQDSIIKIIHYKAGRVDFSPLAIRKA